MSEEYLSPERFGAAFKAFMEAVSNAATPIAGTLIERIRSHLNEDPAALPVLAEEFDPYEHPNVQVALADYLAMPEREVALVGVAAQQRHFMEFGLSVIAGQGAMPGMPPFIEGPVDYVNFHLENDRVLPCVQFGLYFVTGEGERFIVAVIGPSERHGPRPMLRVEVMSDRPEVGHRFLARLRDAMLRLNVYRGHVISLSPGSLGMGPQTLVAFHGLPHVERDEVILPAHLLERIERQTFRFSEHATELLAAGRSLKRGVLLHGPPGTGKTLTLMYLIGRMPDRTVLLASGLGVGMLQAVTQMARSLAPAMIVFEDVDLIAEERGMPYGRNGPLLFELLNEMDGLRDDSDIIFVLTTNRPEVLEPALAARPGRVDLAVELPLPDVAHRRRLLELYAKGLELRNVDLEQAVDRTEGASPAYIKEVLRRAAVLAVTEGHGRVVTGAHLDAALDELGEGGLLAERLLGFQSAPAAPAAPEAAHHAARSLQGWSRQP